MAPWTPHPNDQAGSAERAGAAWGAYTLDPKSLNPKSLKQAGAADRLVQRSVMEWRGEARARLGGIRLSFHAPPL